MHSLLPIWIRIYNHLTGLSVEKRCITFYQFEIRYIHFTGIPVEKRCITFFQFEIRLTFTLPVYRMKKDAQIFSVLKMVTHFTGLPNEKRSQIFSLLKMVTHFTGLPVEKRCITFTNMKSDLHSPYLFTGWKKMSKVFHFWKW